MVIFQFYLDKRSRLNILSDVFILYNWLLVQLSQCSISFASLFNKSEEVVQFLKAVVANLLRKLVILKYLNGGALGDDGRDYSALKKVKNRPRFR